MSLPPPCLTRLRFALSARVHTSSAALDSGASVTQLTRCLHCPSTLSVLPIPPGASLVRSQPSLMGRLTPQSAGVLPATGSQQCRVLLVLKHLQGGREGVERPIGCQRYPREQGEGVGGRSPCCPSSGGLHAGNSGSTLER